MFIYLWSKLYTLQRNYIHIVQPTNSILETSIARIKKDQFHATLQKEHLPTTNNIIGSIKVILLQDLQSYHNIMMWLVCCTALFGFLHCIEFTVLTLQSYDPEAHLSLENVAIDSTSIHYYWSSPSYHQNLFPFAKEWTFTQGEQTQMFSQYKPCYHT